MIPLVLEDFSQGHSSPLLYSEEDLADARQEGLEEGYRRGRSALGAEAQASQIAFAQGFSAHLAQWDIHRAQLQRDLQHQVAMVIEQVIVHLLPTLIGAGLRHSIEAHLNASPPPQLGLAVHPQALPQITPILEGLPQDRLQLFADPDLEEHELRLTLAERESAYDMARLMTDLTELLRGHIPQLRSDA